GSLNVVATFTVTMGGIEEKATLWAIPDSSPKVHFVRVGSYFDRSGLYGDLHGDYPDNAQRFALFSLACLEHLRGGKKKPDVIHAHDWQTGLVPFYARHGTGFRDAFDATALLFTIHNIAYQGVFSKELLPSLGISWEHFHSHSLEFWDQLSLLKSGVLHADKLSTVSPTYSKEIQLPEFGLGFEGILKVRRADIKGILNGLDKEVWNPATDSALPHSYNEDDLGGKAKNKRVLQQQLGLEVDADRPLAAVVSRLSGQKGIDLLLPVMDRLLDRKRIQWVILGSGDAGLERELKAMSLMHPGSMAVRFAFDRELSRLIYAGSDFFLMPSRYEPCGISQLIAMRYGTIPIVSKTGGLVDTVTDLRTNGKTGNGFVFERSEPFALLEACMDAICLHGRSQLNATAKKRAMRSVLSWKASAESYVDLYREAIGMRRKK
ncbi:MAG: glycogen synthase, partial [Planctomycetes bacterium]|nr:glycogen synthase [Planctomycetota bacterium]